MQKPPGVGNPARASAARFAAFGPTNEASVASESGRTNAVTTSLSALISRQRRTCASHRVGHSIALKMAGTGRDPPAPGDDIEQSSTSPHVIALGERRVDHRDLLDRKIRN